jgi:hypothetical protein
MWINGDEVFNFKIDLSSATPSEVRFGAIQSTDPTPQAWTVDWSDIELRNKYYNNAFQVMGYPFTDIGPVYIDNVAQPLSKTVGAYTQTMEKFPAVGMVQFASDDPDFEVNGEVQIRVIENAGGRHPLEAITTILGLVGLSDYIDATALAAAYLAVPNDLGNYRFEGGGEREKRGLKDFASLGIPAADCIKEICSRYLYWFFMDAGKIKIVPYTGTAPAAPAAVALTASNMWAANQEIDLSLVQQYVTAIYGWYERNPSLFYVSGDPSAGTEGVGLDFSWGGPVCCEDRTIVISKSDLLLQFLSAKELIDPVSMTLAGARLELLTDSVSLIDELLNDTAQYYRVQSKEVGLDQGSRVTTLRLVRFLGDT